MESIGERRQGPWVLLVLSCALTIPSVGADAFTLSECGAIVFRTSPPAGPKAAEEPTVLTGNNRLSLYASPDDPIRFSMELGNRWERGGYETTFALTDRAGAILETGRAVDGETRAFSCPVPKAGLYYLDVSPSDSTCTFRNVSPSAAFEASKTFPMTAYPKNGRWFFYVPTGTDRFKIHLYSPVPEKTRVTVADAGGSTIVATENMTGAEWVSETLEVTVPGNGDGQIWSFQVAGPTGWQSVSFWLEGACPYVSDAPEALVIPLLDYELAPAGGQTEVALNFNLADRDLPRATNVSVRVTDESSAIVHQSAYTNLPDKVVFTVPNSTTPVAYRVAAGVQDGERAVVYRDTIWIAHSDLFREIRHENAPPLPPLDDEARARGLLTFSRSEPGAIYPASVPKPEEMTSKIELQATPGQYAAFHFAVHALRALEDVTYRVTALRRNGAAAAGSTGVIDQDAYDLRVVRYWPQRVSAYNNRFHIIPELLDRVHPIPIPEGHNGLFYGRLKIPDAAQPGAYRGTIQVAVGGKCVTELEMVVQVLPFRLRAPGNIHWALDLGVDVSLDKSGHGVVISREHPWDEDTPQEIRARYRAIRDAGINALSLPLIVEFENIAGTLRPKSPGFPPFSERMGIIKELGFQAPVVLRTFWDYLTLEADPNPLTEDKRAYTAPAADVYRQHLSLVAAEAKEREWLDYVYYEVDEPDPPAERAKFIRTAKMIHGAGNKVFSTVGDYYLDEIDELIDYRCINGIGYTCLTNPERVRKLAQDTVDQGDVFWFYGGGSYAYLEGIIGGNRYLNGLFLWRTGATGILNWIACWPMVNMKVDDFDVSKDYCIYYPSCHPEDPLAPTLQWEGIREGIDDYRYLYTLMETARELMASGDREAAARARAIREDMQARLDKLPWRHTLGGTYPPQDIANGDLGGLRQEIIGSMLILAGSPEKEPQ